MIPTSQAYKSMMLGRKVSSRMSVKITSDGVSHTLSDSDIVKGTWSQNWRASNNGEFSLGTTYASSLSFSAFESFEPELDGQYITIEPTVYYKVGNSEQAFPLGVYRCSSPKVFTKTTSYECEDFMLAFDKAVPARFSGTPYNVLSFICAECGVELATSSQGISSMVNSSQVVVIDPERILTYRDALSYVSKILCAYCIMDRSGKLDVRNYHTEPDFELVRMRRKSTEFGGYKTIFSGAKCRFLAEQNFYPYESIDEESEGIILDLGDIPIIEDNETTKQTILDNIKAELEEIEYYPASITMVGDPSIEAGDMITTKDRNGINRNILLTSVSYGWRAEEQIVSEGGNPKLQNVATDKKRSESSSAKSSKNAEVVTATYVNASQITIDSSDREDITSLRFVTNKALTAIFGAEIPVYSSGDGYMNITYTNNGIDGDSVTAQLHAGYNLVTLVNHLPYDANLVVLLKLEAQTSALVSGGTAPTVTIDRDKIRSYIFAQGISTEAGWDGIITIEENVSYVSTVLAMYGITESVSVDTLFPVSASLQSAVDAIRTGVNLSIIDDTMSVELEYGDQILRMGMGHRAGAGRMFAPLITGGD